MLKKIISDRNRIIHYSAFIFQMIILITITAMLNYTSIKVRDIKIIENDGNTKKITLPFQADGTSQSDFTFTGHLYYPPLAQEGINIISKGSIKYMEINNSKVVLSK